MGSGSSWGALGGKAVPARARACLSMCPIGKPGIVTVRLCLSRISIGLCYRPQLPIAQLPSELEKSPLPFSYPLLTPGICSAHCFSSQINFLRFTLIAVYFLILAVGGFCFLLLITPLAPLLAEILPSSFLTDVKEVK